MHQLKICYFRNGILFIKLASDFLELRQYNNFLIYFCIQGRDLESNSSFEKWEYTFHKQEFEDFKGANISFVGFESPGHRA